MKDYFFEKRLARLEKAGNNDFGLILEFGADAYTTEELNTILKKVVVQQKINNRWQNKVLLILLSSTILMAASILAGVMNADFWADAFLVAVPVALVFGIIDFVRVRRQYPNLGDINLIDSIIQQELDWRLHDKLIY